MTASEGNYDQGIDRVDGDQALDVGQDPAEGLEGCRLMGCHGGTCVAGAGYGLADRIVAVAVGYGGVLSIELHVGKIRCADGGLKSGQQQCSACLDLGRQVSYPDHGEWWALWT